MEHIEKLTPIEGEALRLVLAGKTDVEAYRETHPRASQATAVANAYKFFKRAREKLSDQDRMDLYNLNVDRVFSCLNELLAANSDIIYKGQKTGQARDNYTRTRALDMLIRIHGLYKEEILNGEDEPLRIVFTPMTLEDLENDPNVEINN